MTKNFYELRKTNCDFIESNNHREERCKYREFIKRFCRKGGKAYTVLESEDFFEMKLYLTKLHIFLEFNEDGNIFYNGLDIKEAVKIFKKKLIEDYDYHKRQQYFSKYKKFAGINLKDIIDGKIEKEEDQLLAEEAMKEFLLQYCRPGSSSYHRIKNYSITYGPSYGIYERLYFREDGSVAYCAGQSYREEINRIKELLGK